MGINLRDLVVQKDTKLDDLTNRTVAIDAYNALYQFLTSIRLSDGQMLQDWNGRPVSHLSGLLARTSRLAAHGIKPVYVFDGKPSPLKADTIRKRKERKEIAKVELEKAIEEGDMEKVRTKSMQTAHLTKDMVEQSKRLLTHLGVPYIEAPSEGEAQAAQMARDGIVWASASQDFDNLLFGAPVLVRNLTVSGRRKLPRQNRYVNVSPEIITLSETLEAIGITREQLVDLAILVGTDFNDGVKGVGPKTALKLVKEFGTLEAIIEEKEYEIENMNEIRTLFLKPDVITDVSVEWGPIDDEGLKALLCGEFGFAQNRVDTAVETFKEFRRKASQRSLDSFF